MSISKRAKHGFAIVTVVVIATATVQAASVCSSSGTGNPYVCVAKGGATPIELTDFAFDFSDPANPSVELRTGALDWVVSSQVSATDPTPANIGAISINPTIPADDFGVSIAIGFGAGAANVGSIVLSAAGHTGYSNLINSTINGDLNGSLTLNEDAAGNGGELHLTITGDANGKITAPVSLGLHIGGDATKTIRITDFDPSISTPKFLRIEGDLAGTVDVNDYRADLLWIDGDISGTLDIEA